MLDGIQLWANEFFAQYPWFSHLLMLLLLLVFTSSKVIGGMRERRRYEETVRRETRLLEVVFDLKSIFQSLSSVADTANDISSNLKTLVEASKQASSDTTAEDVSPPEIEEIYPPEIEEVSVTELNNL